MYIEFENKNIFPILLKDSPLQDVIVGIFKHLQRVPIPFRPWDSPYYVECFSYEEVVDNLIEFGSLVGISVDAHKCLDQDQSYLNDLHKIYETKYDGQPAWLDFHEHIHLLENYHKEKSNRDLSINFREKAGLLEKSFQVKWLESCTTKLTKGDVYISWSELGKSPFDYWKNQEPDDMTRMKQLAKPWLKLRPQLMIALSSRDQLSNKPADEFQAWWKDHHDEWCQHWNLSSWTLSDMFACQTIGTIENIDSMLELLYQKIYPRWIKL